jgi:hypothetical protein
VTPEPALGGKNDRERHVAGLARGLRSHGPDDLEALF